MKENCDYILISSVDFKYSRSATFLPILPHKKFLVLGNFIKQTKITRQIVKSNQKKATVYVVMSPSHLLVICLWLNGAKAIVLDAGWPLSDSTHLTINIRSIYKKFSNYIIDFISFKLSKIIILESPEQIENVKKRFLVKSSKLKSIYTGFPRERSNVVAQRPNEISDNIISSEFLFFRGKQNKEAGVETIISDFLNIDEKIFLVIATNKQIVNYQSDRILIISRELENSEMVWLYQNCLASIGQFGKSKRLFRTLPHKLFEAVEFNSPYLTRPYKSLVSLLGLDYHFWLDSIQEVNLSNLRKKTSYNYHVKNKVDQKKLQLEFVNVIEVVCK